MSNWLPCSRCGVTRDMEIVERKEEVTIKGKAICFLAHFTRCTTCGNEFETPQQLDDNLDAARETYARMYEAPSPDELVALRARYNASQKAFGMLLGFGELTMNGYENGGTPDSTNRLLLKIAADPHIFKAMYDINSARIGALQRRRIEESEGFRAELAWSGLSALSAQLMPLQKKKIEACAERNSRTISEQVAVYVGAASFQDYSQLYAEATYLKSTPAMGQLPPPSVPEPFRMAS